MLINKKLTDYYMKKHGLDAIIATQPISIKYFSGFNCWLSSYYEECMSKPGGTKNSLTMFCIVPLEGDPILVVPKLLNPFGFSTYCKDVRLFGLVPTIPESDNIRFTPISESASFKNDIEISTYSDPVKAVAKALKDKNIDKSNLGLELSGLNKKIEEQLMDEMKKCFFKDCTEIIRLIRMIKTDEEINLLAKSAEINEIALQKTAQNFKHGSVSIEQFNMFKEIIENLGCELEHYVFSTKGYGINSNKNYVFQKDQSIFLDTGISYSNYFSDTGTTIFIGNLEKIFLDIFKRIFESIKIGLNLIKPGLKCSKINSKMIEYLDKYNIHNTDIHGHGIGLQPSEYPIINNILNYKYFDGFEMRDANFQLEENMVINLEIPYYIFKEGSFIIEISAVVTKNGYRSLTEQKRDCPIMIF